MDALLGQISTLKDGDVSKAKLLTEAQDLMKQMENDKHQLQTSIDSLITVNKQLSIEKDSITGELTNTKSKKEEIEAEKLRCKIELIRLQY